MNINLNDHIKIENAVVYARYSSHSQGEQSIEGQLAKAHEFAASHGYNIIHEYIDRAQSGRTDNRAEFQQMLKDTAKKNFTVIICWKVDRFGRNREEIAVNKIKCKKNGVRVEYVAENIPNTPEGVILESVMEGLAEYYSLQLSQNIRRGQKMSIEKCQALGKLPLGYKANETKKYIIDEDTAPIVQMIFELYSKGQTAPEIAKILNEKGLRTRSGHLFKANSLLTILRNERYTGVYIMGDYRVEGGIPQIISRELFEQVKDLMAKNRRAPANKWTRADYILTDKLFCGHCGAPMVGECGTSQNGNRYNYYKCTHRKRGGDCSKKPVPKEWLEDFVLNAVAKMLYDDELMTRIAHNTWKFYNDTREDDSNLKRYQKELKELETGIFNLMAVLKSGVSSSSIVQEIQNMEVQKKELQQSIAEEEALKKTRLTEEQILYYLLNFRNLDITTINGQRKLIQTFVNSIFLYDSEIVITFNYTKTKNKNNKVTLSMIETSQSSPTNQLAPPKKSQPNFFVVFFLEEVVAVKFRIPARE